jgi:hypothetical protein
LPKPHQPLASRSTYARPQPDHQPHPRRGRCGLSASGQGRDDEIGDDAGMRAAGGPDGGKDGGGRRGGRGRRRRPRRDPPRLHPRLLPARTPPAPAPRVPSSGPRHLPVRSLFQPRPP